MDYLSIAGKIDSINQTMAHVWDGSDQVIRLDEITGFSTPTTKTVTMNESVIMATGSANMTSRRILIITNTGEGVALINNVNTGDGKELEPGQKLILSFASATDGYANVTLYGRAETISTELLIEEY